MGSWRGGFSAGCNDSGGKSCDDSSGVRGVKSGRFVGSMNRRLVRDVLLCCPLAISSCSAPATPIFGAIVDEDGAAVAAAHVRVQGTDLVAWSGKGGEFRLTLPFGSPGTTLAIWKDGFFNSGA